LNKPLEIGGSIRPHGLVFELEAAKNIPASAEKRLGMQERGVEDEDE